MHITSLCYMHSSIQRYPHIFMLTCTYIYVGEEQLQVEDPITLSEEDNSGDDLPGVTTMTLISNKEDVHDRYDKGW